MFNRYQFFDMTEKSHILFLIPSEKSTFTELSQAKFHVGRF